jgi:capsular exopolysaccharide synthesis family protein
VVSPDRGEGRSFVAANLAVTFSQMGQRTLLIDADMRHSRQHLLFGLQNHAGLSAMLSQRTTGNIFRRIEGLRDLSVIGCGGIPPNPVDLLARDAFAQVLEGFARIYDVIVVDTPPAADYPDAEMIAARSRGCVLVAREGVTRFKRAQQLAANVKSAGATVIGSVLMGR